MDELLKRRDPQGYYLVPLRREALEQLRHLLANVEVVEEGDVVYVRVKSRGAAARLAREARRRGLLV